MYLYFIYVETFVAMVSSPFLLSPDRGEFMLSTGKAKLLVTEYVRRRLQNVVERR
jgi:hypothetical protein